MLIGNNIILFAALLFNGYVHAVAFDIITQC